jgi:predicted AAA+ superfamily ATPase
MKRDVLEDLDGWFDRESRKPLIVRGARQVGKTWVVREFAKNRFSNLVEINFDLNPEKAGLFASRDVEQIVRLLAVDMDTELIPGKTLLFLDEIQSAPEVIPLLRYFYEKMPELHVIAAGSLLEFVLSEHTFSMPVGRIEYLFMGPMSFSEFLTANGNETLRRFLGDYQLGDPLPQSIHETLLGLLKVYCAVGGMPAAVRAYARKGDVRLATREQSSILQTYRDDFSKYGARIDARRLGTVFDAIPRLVGQKLKYVNIDRNERAKPLADSVEMLEMARVVYCVTHSAGNGIPLGAEINGKDRKPLFLDVGLLCCSLGLKVTELHLAEDLILVNSGAVAEQFAGQHLLYAGESYAEPEIYYWNREQRSSSSEVDYLFAHGSQVVPVEIKAGKAGSLKSLHVFAAEKGAPRAVRFNTDIPSRCMVSSAVASKPSHQFELISLPLYLIGEMERLLD